MSELSFYSGPRTHDRVRGVIIWTAEIITAAVIALTVFFWFGTTAEVTGRSMEPTLGYGSSVFLDTLDYRLTAPDRFDCVIFERGDDLIIKRIIGLPGETVQIRDGSVIINGEQLDLPWTDELILSAGTAADPVDLGNDEYFVIGDNINGSDDSRSPSLGPVTESSITGRVWAVRSNGIMISRVY